MELDLHRIDLLQTSAAAGGTLLVLPPGENKTQKVAVGDLSGVVQCFSVKRGEVVLSFKTLPSPLKVTAMVLGRAARQRDKMFVAAGNTIRGMTRKGKEFFRFVSSLADTITSLDVAEAHIWAACQEVHNHFVDGADHSMFMAPDSITATELMPLPGTTEWVPVIASRDSCVRVMGRDGKPLFEVPTASPPTAIRYVAEQHVAPAARHAHARELLYGCQDGRVVQLLVDASTVRQGCVIGGGSLGSSSTGSRAAVTAIHCGADYSKTGCADIVVGHEDGALEVWDVDPQGQPQLMASAQLPESITSVAGGYVTNAGSPDIIVHTFTGKVIAFASHPAALIMAAAAATEQGGGRAGLARALSSFNARAGQADLVAALNSRIDRERAELAALRTKVASERERHAAASQAGSTHGAMLQSVVDVRHNLTLQDGAFLLYVESAVPLFALALQSSVVLNLLDMPSNVAILSTSPPDAAAGNATLATYRFQESTNRLTIKFTAAEGAPGRATAFIIPAMPPKTCASISVPLLPLCMHELVCSPASLLQGGRGRAAAGGQQQQQGVEVAAAVVLEQLQNERPFSELVLQGSFSAADVHAWLGSVLPGLPAHWTPSSGSSLSTTCQLFKQHETHTVLGCVYSQGQAKVLSESIATMSILHDALLAAATAARQRVSVSYKLHPGALQHCASLLWPRLEVARRMARRRKLAAALQELQVQEGGDVSFLANEYQGLLTADAATSSPACTGARRAAQDQHAAAAVSGHDGLEPAVEALRGLFRGFCRFSTAGATAAVQRHMPALDKLLHAEGAAQSAGCTLQAAVELMSRAVC